MQRGKDQNMKNGLSGEENRSQSNWDEVADGGADREGHGRKNRCGQGVAGGHPSQLTLEGFPSLASENTRTAQQNGPADRYDQRQAKP